MKTEADYKRAIEVVGSVIRRWDPYALLAHGAPSDEFDPLITRLVVQIPRIGSAHDAAQAVSRVFSSAFQPEGFSLEDCATVGSELFDALSAQKLVGDQGMPNRGHAADADKDPRG